MSKRVKLDRIDMKILRTLQEQGRISNVDLAKHAGLSAPPCLRRVRALEEAGILKSYHAVVDAEKLGFGVTAYTFVSLHSHADTELLKFESHVKQWPQVRDCILLSGEVDYLLRVVAEDWDSYQNFITNHLTKAPNVNAVRSSLAIRTAKAEAGIPLDEPVTTPIKPRAVG